MNKHRKEPRYNVCRFGLTGSLILFPDPREICVLFDNVSGVGTSVIVLSDLTPGQDELLSNMVAESQKERRIPVQLLFNNVKIPVNVVNHGEFDKFGMCLSNHEKLLELAEKGRQFLGMLVDAAVKNGASEADFATHKPTRAAVSESPASFQTAASPAPDQAAQKAVGLPENLKDLPSKHPLAALVKMRFDSFNRKVFFLRSLGAYVAPYYANNYVKQDSEMMKVLGGNIPLQRKTVHRWVLNELNLKIDEPDKKNASSIENSFKQAMYSYMRQKKQNDISFDDIMALFNGKLADLNKPVRDVFLASVCDLLDGEVQKRFEEYHADASEDYLKAKEVKEEEQQINAMTPQELMTNFLWPKIVARGELAQYQKEAARSWVPKEQALKIAGLGGVVILSRPNMEAFLEHSKDSRAGAENPLNYYDELDLKKIYERDVVSQGEKAKGTFRMYIDSLPSGPKKDAILSKVINSAVWSKYYVLKKSKTHFEKVFGAMAPTLCAFIEDNMLTSATVGEYV
ncbi:MAG: hypothetical protein HY280_09295 [Nitrospinae bacterium]|nr:hypothetical protein [Nitrospinota bacterium]